MHNNRQIKWTVTNINLLNINKSYKDSSSNHLILLKLENCALKGRAPLRFMVRVLLYTFSAGKTEHPCVGIIKA